MRKRAIPGIIGIVSALVCCALLTGCGHDTGQGMVVSAQSDAVKHGTQDEIQRIQNNTHMPPALKEQAIRDIQEQDRANKARQALMAQKKAP